MDEVETKKVMLEVPKYSADGGLPRLWPDNYFLQVLVSDGYVTIEGDPAGLRGLAVQLLSLAEADVPPGYGHDLDDLPAELDPGSVPLTLLRTLDTGHA
ncbi:Imm32 family immunity protein [Streptosporangium sp. CA-135522]|uniref:Imm32 family immunity protein n=1 Tax=Streptosporangium sp. CA-135522 TaxID=3240072 RepID=UPI003D8D5A62